MSNGRSVPSAAVGLPSYALGPDFTILDTLGLADPFTADLQTMPDSGFFPRPAGHEKILPAQWAAARLTRTNAETLPVDYPDSGFRMIPLTEGEEFSRQVARARRALRCGAEIRQIEIAVVLHSPRGASSPTSSTRR